MATINLLDVRNLRFLPIKQINIATTTNIYQFADVLEGATFAIEPITTKDASGLDVVVAYNLKLEFTPSRNDFHSIKSNLNEIITSDIKGVAVFFNRNMNLNTLVGSGDLLYIANYSDEQKYNLNTTANLSYSYEDGKPVAKISINSLMSINEAVDLWSSTSWENLTW